MVRPRGRPRGGAVGHGQGDRPDQMQQMLDMLTEQGEMMHNLRNELREVQRRQDAADERQNNPGGQGERHNPLGGQGEAQMQQEVPEPRSPIRPAHEGRNSRAWVKQLREQQAPIFYGKFDSQAAENWLSRMEKIFGILECPDDVKAPLAIYMLEGDADKWWKSTKMILQSRNIPVTWEVFQEKFNEKYFPRSVRITRETEFLTIQQEERERFDEYLARYI